MKLILSGVLLVSTGAALPFLMAIRLIEPSLPLSLLACAASSCGLALGLGVLVSRVSAGYHGHQRHTTSTEPE
jgi:hypothetical protein